jgi:hypothetical protein
MDTATNLLRTEQGSVRVGLHPPTCRPIGPRPAGFETGPSLAQTAQTSRNGKPLHCSPEGSFGSGVENSHQVNGLRGSWPSSGVPATNLEGAIVRAAGAVAA